MLLLCTTTLLNLLVLTVCVCVYVCVSVCRSGVFVAALAKVEALAHYCHVVLGYCSPPLSVLRSLRGAWIGMLVHSKHDVSGLTSSGT